MLAPAILLFAPSSARQCRMGFLFLIALILLIFSYKENIKNNLLNYLKNKLLFKFNTFLCIEVSINLRNMLLNTIVFWPDGIKTKNVDTFADLRDQTE